MSRIPHSLRVAALLFYVLQTGVLAPLHVVGVSPAPPPAFPEVELTAGCDAQYPCGKPAHHHGHHPAGPHQSDHCPACSLAARPATVETPPRLLGTLGVIGTVRTPAEVRPVARPSDHHAPRGPPPTPAS